MVLVALLVAAGCPAPARYREVRPGLSCERATRVAHRTMQQIGYAVTELVPASPIKTGVVTGRKTLPDGTVSTGRVLITCDGSGATLQPIEGAVLPNYDFSRVFGYSFKVLVQRPDVEEPAATLGLQVLVHALTSHEEVLDLGGRATAGNVMLVRVTVRNNTDRVVAVDPERLELVPAAGASAVALDGRTLVSALAPGEAGERVRREMLGAGRIPPGTTASGFLVFPAGLYREAHLVIEDVETGEGEGFVTPVE